ncbi:MAG: hypothetical protein HYY17_09875 [Planctomycetes bacterium]|nr:hypothetical protein [Planctomycetota bacterium]
MEGVEKARRTPAEEVVREFPTIGKYRVRMVQKGGKPPQLDIREYVKSERFEGFTRRGVRLGGRQEWEQLLTILKDAVQAIPA